MTNPENSYSNQLLSMNTQQLYCNALVEALAARKLVSPAGLYATIRT